MTPRERLVVREGAIDAATAEDVMRAHKVKKLPLVDPDGRLLGLVTAKDLIKQERLPFATRDDHGRLRVGAAIGAKGDYLERAAELIRASADVIVIDIAHGHSAVMGRAIEAFRSRFGDVELIAGNVATADGVRFLVDRGVNGVKVGIGPGGGCTTRLNTNFGVPQVEALVTCRERSRRSRAAHRRRRSQARRCHRAGAALRRRHGDAGKRACGNDRNAGDTVQKPVVIPESHKTVKVPFKVFRGMASLQAIVDRLDVEDAESADVEALGAEGTEISVPARGSVRPIVRDMLKHLCSAISYGGAGSLSELQEMFRREPHRYAIRLSESSRRESFDR